SDPPARRCRRADAGTRFHHDKLGNLHRETLIKRTSKAGAGRTPDSPLCDAVEAYAQALAEADRLREGRKAALLHRLRDDARRRLARHKQLARVLTFDDQIDRVADALAGPHGDALVEPRPRRCGRPWVPMLRRWPRPPAGAKAARPRCCTACATTPAAGWRGTRSWRACSPSTTRSTAWPTRSPARTATPWSNACARSTASRWWTSSRTPTRGSGRSSTACSAPAARSRR